MNEFAEFARDARPCRSRSARVVQAPEPDVDQLVIPKKRTTYGVVEMNRGCGRQCAFCSPGFLLTAVALLAESPSPSRDEIREELSGNLCRCTGYQSIVDGVEVAIRTLAENRSNGGGAS